MATNRADEMVLAGSAPAPAPGSDPVAHVHRGTSFIVLVDGAIVVFSAYLLISSLFSGPVVDVLSGGLMLAGLLIYAGYRNRKPWAYWPGVAILLLACLVFIANALYSLVILLAGGYVSNLLFIALFAWAALGSGRRALFHWHPAYRAGYLRQGPLTGFDLEDGEMLAACPSCLAVLAIRPTMLGDADRCPHCGGALVSQALINKYNDEEA
ncbi:MAG: hypothetical protein VXZ04_01980 [Candidatus Thermoplasmatota archaeon]|nr:hypothetical protein [Candidatus Thermoplasmatota archaeon]MEC7504220.1 hypothetical protein [Candidatus Thermoplasmatota archaeon]MEC7507978.1 hypothetical protein [Candidatus Thermoplasmatota archaeon]MEC7635155.1 hypothetical protein [Candidatus Thermoplasmatota archaeon]MEC8168450.1 hypothetical protein [Candidatus Thermoplasmatota archaeon]